jgi:hypothetical protein
MSDALDVKWFPQDYCDEVMPEGRDSPAAWIGALDDGAPAIAKAFTDSDQQWRRRLSDGDIVEFVTLTNHGSGNVNIRADGTWTADPMPAAANTCCFPDCCVETLGSTIEESVEQLFEFVEPDEVAGYNLIVFSAWSGAIPFRFEASTKSFIQVKRDG